MDEPVPGIRTSSGRHGDLLRLLQVDPVRPCTGCAVPCPDSSHAAMCGCGCSASCPEAPRKLSVEPSRYPIEPHVVPIVYALHTSGLAQPCWSCEGHNDGQDRLYKWPRLWFYSNSITYLELLRTTLKTLHDTHRTGRAWLVERCDWQPYPTATMYELAACRQGPEPTLDQLQNDLDSVGRGLTTELQSLASSWMSASLG